MHSAQFYETIFIILTYVIRQWKGIKYPNITSLWLHKNPFDNNTNNLVLPIPYANSFTLSMIQILTYISRKNF